MGDIEMFTSLLKDIAPLDPVHDNRHKLDDSEFSRESLAFMIEVPEAGLGGFLYTWVNGKGSAGAAACLFGPAVGETPIFEVCDGILVPDDMDFYDWQVGSLKLKLQQALKTAHVSYTGERTKVDYHFDANHPAYAYSTHSNGCPQWIADDRFEQQGYVKGSVEVDGREIEIDGYGQRDHSWGTRDWGVNQHWKWVHAQAGNDLGVHFWKLYSLGREHLCGYVNRDGCLAQITDVDVDFSCHKGLQPKSLVAKITDSKGRVTKLEAETFGVFPFPVHELITLFEGPLNLSIEGQKGTGWLEMMWPNDLIGYLKDRTL